jgi:hypothetical protein
LHCIFLADPRLKFIFSFVSAVRNKAGLKFFFHRSQPQGFAFAFSLLDFTAPPRVLLLIFSAPPAFFTSVLSFSCRPSCCVAAKCFLEFICHRAGDFSSLPGPGFSVEILLWPRRWKSRSVLDPASEGHVCFCCAPAFRGTSRAKVVAFLGFGLHFAISRLVFILQRRFPLEVMCVPLPLIFGCDFIFSNW